MISDSPQRPPSLPSELNRFSSQCNRLKQILGETKKCFNDINISGQFEGSESWILYLILFNFKIFTSDIIIGISVFNKYWPVKNVCALL